MSEVYNFWIKSDKIVNFMNPSYEISVNYTNLRFVFEDWANREKVIFNTKSLSLYILV